MKDEVVNRDGEIVEVLNNESKSGFTIEDESTLALLQPQAETSGRTVLHREVGVGEIGSVSRELVMKHIRKIWPNKAEGPDEIHVRLLRELERESSLPFAMIFRSQLLKVKCR